jgi:glycosyltransferase involved in cell wall biosynthesis
MIGNGQDLAQTRQRAGKAPNSEWVDRLVTREELGRLVSRHDVGLGIFGTGPKALRVVPTKVYEVAAAGLAVVTSDTAPQRRALRGAGVLIGPGDGSALADALESLADDRVRCSHLRRSALATARSSWGPARVVEPLVERLSREVTHPGHPVRGPGVSIVHGCRDAATALIRFVLR